jgi:hypothetical protein
VQKDFLKKQHDLINETTLSPHCPHSPHGTRRFGSQTHRRR